MACLGGGKCSARTFRVTNLFLFSFCLRTGIWFLGGERLDFISGGLVLFPGNKRKQLICQLGL
jgi:hypothetical protein